MNDVSLMLLLTLNRPLFTGLHFAINFTSLYASVMLTTKCKRINYLTKVNTRLHWSQFFK